MSTVTPGMQMTQTAFRMFFLLRNPKVLHCFQQGMKAPDVWISLMSGRSVRRATRVRQKWRFVVMLKSPTCCLAAVPNTALNLPQEPPSTTSWRSEKGIETNGVHKTRSFGSLVAFCVFVYHPTRIFGSFRLKKRQNSPKTYPPNKRVLLAIFCKQSNANNQKQSNRRAGRQKAYLEDHPYLWDLLTMVIDHLQPLGWSQKNHGIHYFLPTWDVILKYP